MTKSNLHVNKFFCFNTTDITILMDTKKWRFYSEHSKQKKNALTNMTVHHLHMLTNFVIETGRQQTCQPKLFASCTAYDCDTLVDGFKLEHISFNTLNGSLTLKSHSPKGFSFKPDLLWVQACLISWSNGLIILRCLVRQGTWY